jgi:hypothetical protein
LLVKAAPDRRGSGFVEQSTDVLKQKPSPSALISEFVSDFPISSFSRVALTSKLLENVGNRQIYTFVFEGKVFTIRATPYLD